MFDTVTVTKASAAFLGAWLIYLFGVWAADGLFDIGHHGKHHAQAYTIPTEDDAPAEAVEEVPFEELMAAADAAKGERVFSKCRACHKLEAGANATGPYLHGVVGRDVDAASGFSYSCALEEVVDVWTPEHLYAFLENPRGYAPGTSMSFSGLDKSEDRANLIAYLDTFH